MKFYLNEFVYENKRYVLKEPVLCVAYYTEESRDRYKPEGLCWFTNPYKEKTWHEI